MYDQSPAEKNSLYEYYEDLCKRAVMAVRNQQSDVEAVTEDDVFLIRMHITERRVKAIFTTVMTDSRYYEVKIHRGNNSFVVTMLNE